MKYRYCSNAKKYYAQVVINEKSISDNYGGISYSIFSFLLF